MPNSMLTAVRDAVAGASDLSSMEISGAPVGAATLTDTPATVNAQAHAAATARIKAIMQAPEAKGRADLAQHLAFSTTMDAGAAVAVMRAAPTASAEAGDIDTAAGYERERINAFSGLAMPFRAGSGTSTGIVAAMKRRHGASQER